MGNMKHEGDAVDVVAPAGQEIIKGELYRIDNWTGIAMSHVLPTDPELGFALEVRKRVWYVSIPSGLAAARGATLWWSSGTGFKRGTTDLVAAGTGGATGPACKVEEAVDANLVAGVVVLNNS